MDMSVTPTQLRVLAALGSFMGESAVAWPKQKTIADRIQLRRETTNRALRVLEDKGYIRSAYLEPGKTGSPKIYSVVLDAKLDAKIAEKDGRTCDATITPNVEPVTLRSQGCDAYDHTRCDACDHTEDTQEDTQEVMRQELREKVHRVRSDKKSKAKPKKKSSEIKPAETYNQWLGRIINWIWKSEWTSIDGVSPDHESFRDPSDNNKFKALERAVVVCNIALTGKNTMAFQAPGKFQCELIVQDLISNPERKTVMRHRLKCIDEYNPNNSKDQQYGYI